VHKCRMFYWPIRYVNLEQDTRVAPPQRSHNLKYRRANAQGDPYVDTDPTSVEDTANVRSNLPD